jgi:hypothetical protein
MGNQSVECGKWEILTTMPKEINEIQSTDTKKDARYLRLFAYAVSLFPGIVRMNMKYHGRERAHNGTAVYVAGG